MMKHTLIIALLQVSHCKWMFIAIFYLKVKGSIPTRHVIRILLLPYFD